MCPDRKISLSRFAKIRPSNVVLMKDTPLNSCCCIYCENMKLLFEALKPFLPDGINSLSLLSSRFVCNVENFSCMKGKCSSCPNLQAVLETIFCNLNVDCVIRLEVEKTWLVFYCIFKFIYSTHSSQNWEKFFTRKKIFFHKIDYFAN